MSMWHEEREKRIGFFEKINREINGLASKDIPPTDESVQSPYRVWKDAVGVEAFETMDDAVNSFVEFYRNKAFLYDFLQNNSTLSVKIGRSGSDGTYIEAGISVGITGIKDAHILRLMFHGLSTEIEGVLATEMKKLGATMPNRINGTHAGKEIKTVHLFKMQVSHDGKQKRVRGICSEFSKFGVPIYEEALASIGIEFEKMPLGEQNCNIEADVSLNEKGYPIKAVRLTQL